MVCISMNTLMDHPNPMKKSRYDRFAPMVSKRTSVIALSTALAPIGDDLRRPPMVWPAVKSSEMTEAVRSISVAVTGRFWTLDRTRYWKNGNWTEVSGPPHEAPSKFVGYLAHERQWWMS